MCIPSSLLVSVSTFRGVLWIFNCKDGFWDCATFKGVPYVMVSDRKLKSLKLETKFTVSSRYWVIFWYLRLKKLILFQLKFLKLLPFLNMNSKKLVKCCRGDLWWTTCFVEYIDVLFFHFCHYSQEGQYQLVCTCLLNFTTDIVWIVSSYIKRGQKRQWHISLFSQNSMVFFIYQDFLQEYIAWGMIHHHRPLYMDIQTYSTTLLRTLSQLFCHYCYFNI